MNPIKKVFLTVLMLVLSAGIFCQADEKSSPQIIIDKKNGLYFGEYTKKQYEDYQSRLLTAAAYKEQDDLTHAVLSYMDCIFTYPVMAIEAADELNNIYWEFANIEPTNGNGIKEKQLIERINKVFGEAEQYLYDNAPLEFIISNTLDYHQITEYNTYTGENPNLVVTFQMNWYYEAFFYYMKKVRWNGVHKLLIGANTTGLNPFGEKLPDSFFVNTDDLDVSFEITDKNGKVLIPSENIGSWDTNEQKGTRIYYIKEMTPEARKLYESGSKDFVVRIKSCMIPDSDNPSQKISLDLSRIKIYKEETPPRLLSLFPEYEGSISSISRKAWTRWTLTQKLIKPDTEPAPGLIYIPGKIIETWKKSLELIDPLYILPVTKQVYTSYTGEEYNAKPSGSAEEKFLEAFNGTYTVDEFYGFSTSIPRGCGFSIYSKTDLSQNYDYNDEDLLFAVGIPAEKYDPAYFEENKATFDPEKELMISIPKGTVTCTIPETGPYTASVEDFIMSKYPVSEKDYQDLFSPGKEEQDPKEHRTKRFTIEDAALFCNALSIKYGYEPCYTIDNYSDITWNYSANGFRIPTFDELMYVYHAGLEGAPSDYDYASSSVNHNIIDSSFGVAGLHNNYSASICWDFTAKIPDTKHVRFKNGMPDEKNPVGTIWLCRSSPAEAARLSKKAEIPSYPNVSKEQIQLYLHEVPVTGGKVSFTSKGEIKMTTKKNIKVSSFYMEKTEVPQLLYQLVMGENPSPIKKDMFPVTNISLVDACVFLNRLSTIMGYTPCYSMNGTTDVTKWPYITHTDEYSSERVICDYNADGYRLPTQSEWMYAADIKSNKNIQDYSWIQSNSGDSIHAVGLRNANSFGIYDMIGNVWEFCFESAWAIMSFKDGEKDPSVSEMSKSWDCAVKRGGSFRSKVQETGIIKPQEIYFDTNFPDYRDDIGFRFVRKADSF